MIASKADSPAGSGGEAADDPLLAFNAEPDLDPAAPPVPVTKRVSVPLMMVVVGAVLIAVAYSAVQARNAPGARAASGTGNRPVSSAPIASAGLVPGAADGGSVDITSRPPGAAVTVDGEPRGLTPLHLSLPVGSHLVGLSAGSLTSTLPLTVDPGVAVRQHVEFAAEPAGRQPIVAGPESSTAAALVDRASTTTTVPPAAGKVTAAVPSSAATIPEPAAMGWVRLTSPIEIEVFELDRLIEPSPSGRLRLPPGRHDLEVVNPRLNFRTTLRVEVPAGRTITAAVTLPNGSLSINAIPWANVSVDDRGVGVTPLGNLSLPIGQHEVIWRHPQLGERRQTVTITARQPVGVGMDLTK